MNNTITFSRAICAEAIGTAMLLAAVVGSGIMGERLAGGNVAIALLANTVYRGSSRCAYLDLSARFRALISIQR